MIHVINVLMLVIERRSYKNRAVVLFVLVGHVSKQCPNVSLKSCFHCKRMGHRRSICPTKQEGTTSVEEVKKTSVIISSSEDKPPPNS